MPRVTSAEVPSGKTSHSLTDSDAAGASALTRSRTRGWPSSTSPSASHSQVQRPGVVLALVAGLAPRQVAGAVDPGGGAGVGVDLQRRAGPARAATSTLAGGGGPLVADPAALVQVEVGRGAGRAADEDLDAVPWLLVPRCRAATGRTTAPSPTSRSIRGPGIAVVGSACAHGPASSRCGTPASRSAATVRKELLR